VIAFLAPGQGAEHRGMGLSVAGVSSAAAAVLDEASSVLGKDVPALLSRGGRDLLHPEVAQVAVAAVALSASAALREHGVAPGVCLGHSAGELAAACTAGHFEVRHALTAYEVRARAMTAAAKARRGGMATLDGSPDALARAIALGSEHGTLVEAGRLAPERWLLAGDEAALRAASVHVPLVPLEAAGAWHSPLMEPAVAPFREALLATPPSPTRLAIFVSNDDAQITPPAEVVSRLCAQLTRPMRFAESLRTLARLAPIHVVMLGPARTLRALLRLSFGSALPFALHGTESAEELADTLRLLS
jgi:[acyl-carrier-protein] S-malonyltransferase